MKIGFIGLGRMGKEIVLRLLEQGVNVVVYNRSREKTDSLISEFNQLSSRGPRVRRGGRGDPLRQNSNLDNLRDPSTHPSLRSGFAQDDTSSFGKLIPTYNLSDLVNNLNFPRVIWLMVEHGKPVDEVIEQLISSGVRKDDVIIDGGNSFYKDSIRRFEYLKKKGIHFLDIGTSGGLEGARNGACIMVGGEEKIFKMIRPILEKISVPGGVAYFGSAGAGHFVKMTHNGVEYGMLQAIGEGFEMLSKGMPVTEPFARGTLAKTVGMDLHKVASNWSHGSVVRGWLMELLERALKEDPKLDKIEGVIGGGSTGEWTVVTAKELKVETPVIEKSLEARKKSFKKPAFSGKVVATLRREFGGHEIKLKTQRSNIKTKI